MPSPQYLLATIDAALAEDVGAGDWTTLWTVPANARAEATIVAKAAGTVAGIEAASATFTRIDPTLEVTLHLGDGDAVRAGQEVAWIRGSARAILTGERVALNFLQRLSGIATLTRRYVSAVEGTGARILDTRKTTPGLRRLEKDAVLAGGGANHRFGLHDMVLIKENHIRAAGGITAAVKAVATQNREGLAVEVETTDLAEVREALAVGVDRILLDNMATDRLREAVGIVKATSSSTETEASGGITLDTVGGVAATGVDFISVGALTHSAPALDLSLLIRPRSG
ncbi:MAG: carboxylating nicotinate-nucleotide diphosphorylase [Gemmatimonadota bacterium]